MKFRNVSLNNNNAKKKCKSFPANIVYTNEGFGINLELMSRR